MNGYGQEDTMGSRLLHAIVAFAFMGAAPAVLAQGAAPDAGGKTAIFAGGCFWCMEHPFDGIDGVISVTSGYTGGTKSKPTYEEVSSGTTGHAEAVQVVYDPAKVSYQKLFAGFWRNTNRITSTRNFSH